MLNIIHVVIIGHARISSAGPVPSTKVKLKTRDVIQIQITSRMQQHPSYSPSCSIKLSLGFLAVGSAGFGRWYITLRESVVSLWSETVGGETLPVNITFHFLKYSRKTAQMRLFVISSHSIQIRALNKRHQSNKWHGGVWHSSENY